MSLWGLDGATLAVIRTRRGLEVFEGAVRAGYVEAVEADPVYVVQYATLLKLSKRILKRPSNMYVLPRIHDNSLQASVPRGHPLASREPL
uniref:Uncharacterized protein n=1 Tax=Ignisphaera aggregans TaxID=334771 RepID=A0A7J3YTT0_9CREN